MSVMMDLLTPICTGVAVSLIVFFVTKYYSMKQAKKEAEIEQRENDRINIAKQNSDKIDDLTELCLSIAQHVIITIGNEYLKQGAITSKEKAIFDEIYEPYKHRGGNSYGKAIKELVDKLPRVVEE